MTGFEFLFRLHGTSELLTMKELLERMDDIISEKVQRDFKEFDNAAIKAMEDMMDAFKSSKKVEIYDSKLISKSATKSTLGDMTVKAALEKFS